MTVRECLKRARARIVAGDRDLYRAVELSAEDDAEICAALDLLEDQASPNHAAMLRAVGRWAISGSNADGLAAVEAAKRPGAPFGLWDWIHDPSRRRGHVLRLFDTAILRNK